MTYQRGKRRNDVGEEDDSSDSDEYMSPKKKSSLSVKDSAIIIFLSTLMSVSLVTGTLGISGLQEKLSQDSYLDVLIVVILFIFLFSVLSYVLVKFAAHYLVYLAIATFCAIIFPVSQRKQRKTLKVLCDRAETRDVKSDSISQS